jgi:DHA3 family macrolide efflux protein-like MFS transporter
MVPKERLTNINGLDQSFSGAMNLVSGPLGALLLALINVQGLLWIDVFTALVAVGILAGIKVPNPDRKAVGVSQDPMKEYWKDLKMGIRYTLSWKGLMLLMFGALVLNFLVNPAFTLLPLLTTEHFHKGAIELGVSESLFGAGVLVMGIAMGAWGGFKKKMLNVTVGIFTMGVGLLLIGFSPEGMIGFSYVAAAVIGMGMVMTNAPINGSMQENVHPEMQGRVNSLVSSLATMGMPIGLIIAGPVSEAIGITTWFMISGIIFVILSPIYVFNKDVNTLHTGHPKNAALMAEFGIELNAPIIETPVVAD